METLKRQAIALTAHGEPDVMQLIEEDVPAPSPDQVSIGVHAIGVNFGDILTRQGQYRLNAPLDIRPGLEVAGIVLSSNNRHFHQGQRVAAFVDHGGYASVVNAPANRVFALPDDISFIDAASLLIQGTTALMAVRRIGKAAENDWVLIHAAGGGVGSLAIQIARIAGARVVASASTLEKRNFATSLGAEAVVEPNPSTLRSAVKAATNGEGIDVALDSIGGELGVNTLATLSNGGRMVIIGAASLEPTLLDARRFLQKSLTVSGFVLASIQEQDPTEPSASFNQVIDLFSEGRLTHAVTTMPFEEVARAHEAIERRTVTGKIVLRVDQ